MSKRKSKSLVSYNCIDRCVRDMLRVYYEDPTLAVTYLDDKTAWSRLGLPIADVRKNGVYEVVPSQGGPRYVQLHCNNKSERDNYLCNYRTWRRLRKEEVQIGNPSLFIGARTEGEHLILQLSSHDVIKGVRKHGDIYFIKKGEFKLKQSAYRLPYWEESLWFFEAWFLIKDGESPKLVKAKHQDEIEEEGDDGEPDAEEDESDCDGIPHHLYPGWHEFKNWSDFGDTYKLPRSVRARGTQDCLLSTLQRFAKNARRRRSLLQNKHFFIGVEDGSEAIHIEIKD